MHQAAEGDAGVESTPTGEAQTCPEVMVGGIRAREARLFASMGERVRAEARLPID